MTNREWLNQLSDEQYLKAINIFRWELCSFCRADFYKCDCECYKNQLDWLQQEHDERKWRNTEKKCNRWRGRYE